MLEYNIWFWSILDNLDVILNSLSHYILNRLNLNLTNEHQVYLQNDIGQGLETLLSSHWTENET